MHGELDKQKALARYMQMRQKQNPNSMQRQDGLLTPTERRDLERRMRLQNMMR